LIYGLISVDDCEGVDDWFEGGRGFRAVLFAGLYIVPRDSLALKQAYQQTYSLPVAAMHQ